MGVGYLINEILITGGWEDCANAVAGPVDDDFGKADVFSRVADADDGGLMELELPAAIWSASSSIRSGRSGRTSEEGLRG